jgi:hypothetical protein
MYIRVRSETVVAVAITRGTLLALTAAAHDLTFGAPAWLAPFYGLAGIAALALVWLVFWAHDSTLAKARLTTIRGRAA